MAAKPKWKAVLLWVSLTFLALLGTGGLALREMLKDPDAGTLRGVYETDENVNEMRIIAFNSGRIKVIKRSEKAQISRTIEAELRSAGLTPLLPMLVEAGRRDWTLSRQVGFPGPQIQIHGSANCNPQSLADILPDDVSAHITRLENGALQLAANGRGERALNISFFPRGANRYQINLALEPKKGTPPVTEADLKPFTKGEVMSMPRDPEGRKKPLAS